MRRLALVSLVLWGCQPDGIDVLRPTTTPLSPDGGGFDLQPSLCSVANVDLCEGFEGNLLGFPPWGLVEIASSVSIDAGRAFRGQHSLRVTTDAQPGGPQLVLQGEVTQDVAVPGPLL